MLVKKICKRCNEEKFLKDFNRNKPSKDGHLNICSLCTREGSKNYYKTHFYKWKDRYEEVFTPTYITWKSMINRCNNSKNEKWHRYGGRGILVCERWIVYENFLEDMGERIGNMTLDRINNNLGYFKENCRWTTNRVQQRNRNNNISLIHNGETMLVIEWSERIGIKYGTVWARLKKGLSIDLILASRKLRK